MDSCLNVVEEALGSLAISNVKCDRADPLARLLCGSMAVEGGGGKWSHDTEELYGAGLS